MKEQTPPGGKVRRPRARGTGSIFMPKGSTLEAVFHYDNSGGNRHNPDPTAEVHWGDQTWEEMMLGYYGTVDAPGANGSTNQQ